MGRTETSSRGSSCLVTDPCIAPTPTVMTAPSSPLIPGSACQENTSSAQSSCSLSTAWTSSSGLTNIHTSDSGRSTTTQCAMAVTPPPTQTPAPPYTSQPEVLDVLRSTTISLTK